MSKVVDQIITFVRPIVEDSGLILWDVEYVSEGGQWYLRIYIDKEGGVSIEDCEKVSRAVDPILDEKDPIPTSYIFEVSSAGLERALKLPEHFARFIGSDVEVRLYKPMEGAKQYMGILKAYENGAVTLDCGEKTMTFAKEEVAGVRLRLV